MFRKVALAALVALLSAIGASAQARREGLALSTFGPYIRPIPGASVRVCQHGSTGTTGCTPLQTIYSDFALTTPITGSIVTPTSAGYYTYFIANGTRVDEVVSGVGVTATKTTDITIGIATSGTVTSFSAGNLSPLFTTSVGTATTTPALSFSLSTAAANKVFGNCTTSTAAPSYCTLTAAMFPAPFIPNDDNMTDLGGGGSQWRTGYFGTSVISPIFQSKSANAADGGVFRIGNNEALCAELASPGTDGCITFSTTDLWRFSVALQAPDGAVGAPAYGFTTDPDTGIYLGAGTQINFARNGVSQFGTNGGPGITSSGTVCMTTTTRCWASHTMPTTTNPAIKVSGGAEALGLPVVAGDVNCGGCTTSEDGFVYFNSTTNLPRYWDGSALDNFGTPVYNGTGTKQTTAHTVIASCTLGTDCAVTLTNASVFTSSSSYKCAALDTTAAAAIRIQYTSGSQFTLTGTGTDVLHYLCIGN